MPTEIKKKKMKAGVCEDCGNPTYESRALKCKTCWLARPVEGRKNTARKYQLKRKYKLSFEDYDGMLKIQKSSCAICGINQSDLKFSLSVDHDRSCCQEKVSCGECVRGLLCNKCNLALGYANDNIDLLNNMIKYLKKHDGGKK